MQRHAGKTRGARSTNREDQHRSRRTLLHSDSVPRNFVAVTISTNELESPRTRDHMPTPCARRATRSPCLTPRIIASDAYVVQEGLVARGSALRADSIQRKFDGFVERCGRLPRTRSRRCSASPPTEAPPESAPHSETHRRASAATPSSARAEAPKRAYRASSWRPIPSRRSRSPYVSDTRERPSHRRLAREPCSFGSLTLPPAFERDEERASPLRRAGHEPVRWVSDSSIVCPV